jgi:plastocyanin
MMVRKVCAPAAFAFLCAALANTARGGDLTARVIDQDGKPLIDAVVVAKPLSAVTPPQVKPVEEVVDQIDKEFVPRVKPVLAGSRVRFPNSDSVRHQVYSFSAARKFELPLYAGTTAPSVVFDTPGVVVLGCNIHDWMVGYIYVSETPWFGKTQQDGAVLLKDLPPGDYNVRVWQPSMSEPEGATVKRVTVTRSAVASAEWRLTLKPAFRIRRAPAAGGGGYR